MRSIKYLSLTLLLATNAISGQLSPSAEFWRATRTKSEALAEFETSLRTEKEAGNLQFDAPAGDRSVGKAVLLSAVLPGAGQVYNKSYLKSAAFLAIEALSIVGYVHFSNENDNLERQFEAFAEANWTEEAYWDWIYREAVADGNSFGRGDPIPPAVSELRDWERDKFSHSLPARQNQQWYENIGKYNQFIMGWDEFRNGILDESVAPFTYATYESTRYRGQDIKTISPARTDYTYMRRDANEQYKHATNLLSLLILNHVVSAFEAGFSAKRHNQSFVEKHMQLDFFGMPYRNQIVPAVAVTMNW